jgi:hypothetical protein
VTSSTPKGVVFSEGGIQVARFLGGEVRFRAPRQRSPSGYDPGRAFQRVQSGQRGLPPQSRRASAKQTVECSVHEAARFASAELLGRAWFTLPLMNVLGGVQVGEAAPTALGTREVVAVACAPGTAGRTALARLERVNLLDVNPGLLCLVDDELLQLVEPPGVNATPVASLSDTVQVLEFQHGILELDGPVNEATGGVVAQITNPALFFVTLPSFF